MGIFNNFCVCEKTENSHKNKQIKLSIGNGGKRGSKRKAQYVEIR